MDFETERRRALPLLRRLHRELAGRGCGVAMLDSRPCLAVATHHPDNPLSVLVDATGTYFTWANGKHHHSVDDVAGAASAIVACVPAARNGQAMSTDQSPRLRHLQIAEVIRDRIKRGEWAPRDRIPSHLTLAEEFDVSPHTVWRAIAHLRERRYVWTLPHKGSYARPPEYWLEAGE